MKRILAVIMVTVAACSPASDNAAAAGARQTPCEVALAWLDGALKSAAGKKLVFDDRDRALRDPGPRAIWHAPDADREVQGPDLAKFGGVPGTQMDGAVGACAGVRAMLDDRGIAYGEKAADDAAGLYELKATVINFSLPLVSRRGDEAIIMVSRQYEPLNGGGYLEYLRRSPDGRWAVIAVTGLWVS